MANKGGKKIKSAVALAPLVADQENLDNFIENGQEPEDQYEMQIVAIDHGDLLELQQSAEAWASYLRLRASNTRKDFGALPIYVEDANRYEAAADRIDRAIGNTRRDAQSSIAKANG